MEADEVREPGQSQLVAGSSVPQEKVQILF